MISLVRAGFVGTFFSCILDGVKKLGRVGSGFEAGGRVGAGVVRDGAAEAAESLFVLFDCITATDFGVSAGAWISGGSEDGGSEPKLGLKGVRNGDLNGLLRVFAASFSRRRFTCGVDICDCSRALGLSQRSMRLTAGWRVIRS